MRAVYEWVSSVIVAAMFLAAFAVFIVALSVLGFFYPIYFASLLATIIVLFLAVVVHEELYK